MKKYFFLILFLLLAYFVLNTLYDAGSFKTIENHTDLKNISVFTGIAGPEDFDIDPDSGWLFISNTDRWNLAKGNKTTDGISLWKLNENTTPHMLTTTFHEEFHPHGISYLKKGSENYLFVINHHKTGSSVELFRFKNDTLFHLVTYENNSMCCPNDLVAVDTDKFYVSNDHGNKKGIMRKLEDYLRLPKSSVLYFNGEVFSKVIDHLNYANGLMVSPDGKTLYLTETTSGKISVFDRDINSGALKLRFEKHLKTGLDNITMDANGDLWVAAHPKLFDFVGHAKNAEHLSPSQVFKMRPIGKDNLSVTEVYLNNGEQLSGSSVALYYKGEVYIGVVFDNKLLKGDMLN